MLKAQAGAHHADVLMHNIFRNGLAGDMDVVKEVGPGPGKGEHNKNKGVSHPGRGDGGEQQKQRG